MNKKLTPYFFLIVLVVVLFFILGFRSGQQVEKTNKIINILISIPPTQTPAPTSPLLAFQTYTHKGCGINFLYPNSLLPDKESSEEASFKSTASVKKKDIFLTISCFPQTFTERPVIQNKDWEKKFQNQTVIMHQTVDGLTQFMIKHPISRKFVTISVSDSLLPLLEKSLTFDSK